jgi:hypothetical protein
MDLHRLRLAISLIADKDAIPSARQVAYLRTYPALLSLARAPEKNPECRILQLAAAAYGWMPRILRLNSEHISRAAKAIEDATDAAIGTPDLATLVAVADCLYSVVGASKVLHFANPQIYPIWDARVQRVWGRADPTQSYMGQPRNYISYAREVHQLCELTHFISFAADFRRAHEERLTRLAIPSYTLSNIRMVESAAFELSGGEYDEI